VKELEEEEDLVEVDGMEVQAAAPGDMEKVDRSQILQLRQQLDSDLHITVNIEELQEKGKVTTWRTEESNLLPLAVVCFLYHPLPHTTYNPKFSKMIEYSHL